MNNFLKNHITQCKLKQEYRHPDFLTASGGPQANLFETIWDLDLVALEEGNYDRGGWSTVCCWEVDGQTYFIKRQSDHLCMRINWRGLRVPTFKAEFDRINWYNRQNIPSLDVAYFGWRQTDHGTQQAILVTESLVGFTSLDRLLTLQPRPREHMWQVYRSIGKAVRRMHDAGIEHYHLYPKHVFVSERADEDGLYQVRFIDLEASRRNFGLKGRKLRDLETLSRRSIWASNSNKLRAMLAYANKQKVDSALRADIEVLLARTNDKLLRP